MVQAVMVQAVYDPKTKKFTFPKPEAGKKGERKATVRVNSTITVPNSVYDQLYAAAKADGADLEVKRQGGEIDKDTHNWKGRDTVALYSIQAINDFLGGRAKK